MASEPKGPKELPEVPGATLELHWADFKKLLERHAALAPPKPTEPPPVEFVLGPVEVSGEVTPAGPNASATLKAGFDLKALKTGWVRIPLLEGDLALRSAKADGEELAIDPEDTSPLSAWVLGPAEHRVELEFSAPLLADAEQSAFEFTLPGAPVVNVAVKIPRSGIDAEVSPAVGATTAESGGATTVKAAVPSGQSVRVSWTRAREVVREKPTEPPQVFARTEAFVGVGDGTCRAVIVSQVSVLKAPVSSLTFEVPGDATVSEVRGPHVASWEAKAGSPQQVRVELRGETKGTLPIQLELDRPWDEKPPVSVPLSKLLGAERETGFLAVAAMTALELTPSEAKLLQRVDTKELPPALATRLPFPVVLAFKFREAGGALGLTVQRHADLPVVTAMADTAEHTVLQTADGKRVSRSTYRIRNAQRQFVRIKLPSGAQVWSTLLDGAAVKPAAGADGVVLVPLKKAASFAETEQAFEVEVVTMAESGAMADKGKLTVQLPQCDLPVGALRFSLWLPEGFLYDDFSGTLEEVRGFRDPWSAEGTVSQAMQHVTPPRPAPLAPPPPPAPVVVAAPPPPPPGMPMPQGFAAGPAAAPAMSAPATRASLAVGGAAHREMAKRKMSDKLAAKDDRDMDELAASEEEAAYPAGESYDGSPADAFGQVRLEPPKDLGVLPVRMQVPEKGLCYAFEKLLVLDEPLAVETEYAREKVAK